MPYMKRLAGGRAAGYVDVDGDDAVAAAHDAVAVVVVTAAIGAGAHADDPAGIWHLIVNPVAAQVPSCW